MIFIVSFGIRKRSHFKIQILDTSVIHFSRSDVLAADFTRDLDRVIVPLLHPKEAFFTFSDPETRHPTFGALNLTTFPSLASSVEKFPDDEMRDYTSTDTENCIPGIDDIYLCMNFCNAARVAHRDVYRVSW